MFSCPSIKKNSARHKQAVEYGLYVDYIQHANAPSPENKTKTIVFMYSVQDGVLVKSYLPGHLRRTSTFLDQLVVPENLVGLILHAYHDHVLSGGHLAFRPTTTKSAKNIGGLP